TSDSLPAALAAARHVPAPHGPELAHTARAAFTASLHVTGLIAAAIFAAAAVLVVLLRPTATAPAPATSVAEPEFQLVSA
ncbi:MAG: MFS transporter, partial [Catenulispora sp.]